MAETEVTSRLHDDHDAVSRQAVTSRGLTIFIISTVIFMATYFLLAELWRGSLYGMPQFPTLWKGNGTEIRNWTDGETGFRMSNRPAFRIRNWEGNNTEIRIPRPILDFGSLAPDPDWQFNPEANANISKSCAKLHPSVHLMKIKMPRLAQYETALCDRAGETPGESDAHCRTDHSATIGHYSTCAVVGNSGVLLGSHCGNEIDSRDYVIRMDIPVVKGYESDVGRRTSMTIFNLSTPKRLQSSARLKNRTQDVYESRLRNLRGTALVTDKKSRRKIISVARKYRVTFSLYTIKGSLRRGINPLATRLAHKQMGGSATTGIVTVLMATTFCDVPHLYGFFPFQRDARNTPIPYHYYPGDYIKPINQNEGGHHHMRREYDFLRDLHKQGVLKMQVGPCGQS
ncbi:PREDICTED: alpha-2,8-sialyltransferase 8B-like [Branchiostoma belcheri]|uniref:Alpha-2,8-sialyltransferase 8B-like n=1 Tax=Branchiostoma belcheri TaxID=7741 RepID=A0A6P4XZQ7_BRABE|nr:PREDICTED: alpha-2,8-sialyltransferase 8B-like [Branchiostoma belcheri]